MIVAQKFACISPARDRPILVRHAHSLVCCRDGCRVLQVRDDFGAVDPLAVASCCAATAKAFGPCWSAAALALRIAGITKEGLTPYSLRNTFNSIGESLFGSSLALRDSLGHVGADMTELYNRTTADERAEVAVGILDVVRSARPSSVAVDAHSG